jgi:pimeloyl-ACP methyl ester carboxylesterase
MPMSTDNTVQLRDGRTLAYAEWGDPAGAPIFFFQGTPSSRLFHHPDLSIAENLGARIITADRPGYGLSTFQPGRTLLDWPDDVLELADHLGLARFAVGGISGGGPFAAACAFKLPQRVTAAALVSSVGPVDAPGTMEAMLPKRRMAVRIARVAPWLIRPILWLVSNPNRDPQQHFEEVYADSSAADQAVLGQAGMREMFVANWAEANRNGVRAYAQESVLFARPWNFALEEIVVPVYLWHGEADASTPLAMARHVADRIPHCQAKIVPNAGHFLFFEYWRKILEALVNA